MKQSFLSLIFLTLISCNDCRRSDLTCLSSNLKFSILDSAGNDILFGTDSPTVLDSITISTSQANSSIIEFSINQEFSRVELLIQEDIEYYINFNDQIDTITGSFIEDDSECCDNDRGIENIFFNGTQADCESYICTTQKILFRR